MKKQPPLGCLCEIILLFNPKKQSRMLITIVVNGVLVFCL